MSLCFTYLMVIAIVDFKLSFQNYEFLGIVAKHYF